MPESHPLAAQPAKSAVALLLTFVAGFVDIIGYLAIYHLFTAHVSGTTVHLGHNLALRNWTTAAMSASVVSGFLGGSIVGRAVIEAGARLRFRRVASVNIAAEAALLGAFLPLAGSLTGLASRERVCVLLGVLAIAMGLQTATLTRIGALTIHTTFVTGMINKLAQLVSHILFYTYDVLSASDSHDREHYRRLRHHTTREAGFFFCIWLIYLIGAVLGTWIYFRIGLLAIYLPASLLVLTIITDQFKPLSLQEERDQSER